MECMKNLGLAQTTSSLTCMNRAASDRDACLSKDLPHIPSTDSAHWTLDSLRPAWISPAPLHLRSTPAALVCKKAEEIQHETS
jgi:hypothetical protein